LLSISILTGGCRENAETIYQGYIEGDYVLLASPQAGRLTQLAVTRGSLVEAGDLLFSLDPEPEVSMVETAGQEVRRAESRLQDLLKGGRPSELAALRSRQDQARASLALSLSEFKRREKMYEQQAIAREELERARADLKRDQAALAELKAQLATAQLGSRSDTIDAARAELAAARARLKQAEWAAAQKTRTAPQAALVFDTLFKPAELVPAGAPVVSLLPPQNLKILFFVPEPLLATLRIGQRISVAIDGHPEDLAAQISFISPAAEYTPPVIYSRETRAKLVFRVEARPETSSTAGLHPGQPVDVRLNVLP
jgi:HlyD family secretion protein